MSRRLLLRLLASSPPAGDHVADAELLRRFAASADAAAFELVVRRHAGAVWTACRRVLPDTDAEDAFQATFLALIRNAGAVRDTSVGGWLHRVAVHAALKLRARAVRAAVASDDLDAIPTDPSPPPDAEAVAAVHEELARLPDRERLPVVLCDLEGLSHADAAAALGWPVGTVSGRLSRARAKLRDRLERRGLTPPAALLPVLSVPPQLISRTQHLTAGAAPPAVASLAEGVLHAMRIAKLKLTAAAVATGFALVAGIGTGLALVPAPVAPIAQEPPVAKAPPPKTEGPPPKADPGGAKDPNALTLFADLDVKSLEDMVEKCPILFGKDEPLAPKAPDRELLLRAMLNNARQEVRVSLDRLTQGVGESRDLFDAAGRAAAAARALDRDRAIPSLRELVRLGKWYEKVAEARIEAGQVSGHVLNQARYRRLAAELALVDAIEAAKRPNR